PWLSGLALGVNRRLSLLVAELEPRVLLCGAEQPAHAHVGGGDVRVVEVSVAEARARVRPGRVILARRILHGCDQGQPAVYDMAVSEVDQLVGRPCPLRLEELGRRMCAELEAVARGRLPVERK